MTSIAVAVVCTLLAVVVVGCGLYYLRRRFISGHVRLRLRTSSFTMQERSSVNSTGSTDPFKTKKKMKPWLKENQRAPTVWRGAGGMIAIQGDASIIPGLSTKLAQGWTGGVEDKDGTYNNEEEHKNLDMLQKSLEKMKKVREQEEIIKEESLQDIQKEHAENKKNVESTQENDRSPRKFEIKIRPCNDESINETEIHVKPGFSSGDYAKITSKLGVVGDSSASNIM
mmetsp:Transcript_22545/g.36248  ORF Transcript_22545/g.36248 Transcript_22545/m.36248 type:complete len:227 (+) Transcript_22545:295-975(+)